MILSLRNGLQIGGVPFVLDASRPEQFAFASHAHADHCGRHRRVLCTPATADLARSRFGKSETITIVFGQLADVEGTEVTLFSAGHVLGSAQILMTVEGQRILYTGDLKPAGGKTAPPAAIPACDILIIETTYGRPEYVFPPVEKTIEQLVLIIKRAFIRGLTPVILAYGLGKAQETMALLEDQGFAFACHRSVYDIVEIYRKHRLPLSGAELFSADHLRGKVVMMPPGMSRSREWRSIKNPYTVFLSGWAVDNSPHKLAVDLLLPLSDHADYPQLLDFIEKTGARMIYTVHGFSELADRLMAAGRQARHLSGKATIDMLTGRDARPGNTYDLFDQAEKPRRRGRR